jgi:hypothetical protein
VKEIKAATILISKWCKALWRETSPPQQRIQIRKDLRIID